MQKAAQAYLARRLGNDDHSRRRIAEYYLPVFSWLREIISDRKPGRAVIVGINGQQGCGKTTLCRYMAELFGLQDQRVISVSVDDFYLRRDQQVALANKYSRNPYLQQRGYPGTHDVNLAVQSLTALRELPGGAHISCPRYDKSAHAGQGDRLPEAQWPAIEGPVDLVLFEGWMLGYTPIEDYAGGDENLLQINRLLGDYSGWSHLLDAFLHLDSDDIDNVLSWRVEAEENMKAAGKTGMSRAEVEAYVRLFLPCYELYLPRLREHPPVRGPYLRLELGLDRLPV